ncbi:hypothetical protein GCT19_18890 [Paraburkholderia sp. CNPSo 3155]|nr:hypothetical protein [Paraburkholderia atlantica]
MFVLHRAALSRQRRSHGKDPSYHGLVHRRLWPDCDRGPGKPRSLRPGFRYPLQGRERRLSPYGESERGKLFRVVAALPRFSVVLRHGIVASRRTHSASLIEFDVDDVEAATAELEAQGYRMLVRNRKEPWGQTVSRFIGPEGLLVGITFTPWMRDQK